MGASIGFIERVVGGCLIGWGISDVSKGGASAIRLLIDGEPVVEIASSIPRPDVSENNLRGERAGFEITIPRRFRDGRPHRLQAIFTNGTALQFIGADGTSALIGVVVLELEMQVQGHADGWVDGALRGWAVLVPPKGGLGRGGASVTVLIDRMEVATIIASLPRPDILRALGVEHSGFAFKPPRHARDGAFHEASFLVGGEPLPGCPLNFRVPPEQRDFPLRSCAPSLYDAGGFYEDGHLLETLRTYGAPDNTVDLGQVFPAGAYERPIPHTVAGLDEAGLKSLHDSFGRWGARVEPGAPCHLIRLEDVYVQDNTIHRIEGDRVETIYETARGADRPYVKDRVWTPSALREAALEVNDVQPRLYLGSVGYTNYGHWLVDDLPRAMALPRVAEHAGPVKPAIVLASTTKQLDSMKKMSLRFIHPRLKGRDLLFVPPGQPVHFRSLYYATPVSHHPAYKSPEACAYLRALAVQIRRAEVRPERIYVRRRSEHGRNIVNERAVTTLLARRGFTTIDPELLSFTEQVKAFSAARLVVGTMGAAMTSTLFCSEGTDLVYLAPDTWQEPFYWDLAACCGHRYAALFGPVTVSGVPPHLADFRINTRTLDRLLDRVLAQS